MNRKRKILTLIVLAALGAIIFFTYYSFDPESGYLTDIPAIRKGVAPLFFFALAALYLILFFFFGEWKYTYIDKRKILTVVALVVFGVIIAGHYIDVRYERRYELGRGYAKSERVALVSDVRMPLLVLAVFYVGLFFLLGDKKRDS
jgi:hypothetical protein